MISNVEQQLNSYIHQLNAAQKKSLLGFIKTLIPGKNEEAITIEQYNRELEEADAAMDGGEFYTNDEVFDISERMIEARKKG